MMQDVEVKYEYYYPRPSVAATVVVANMVGEEFILGIRSKDSEAYPGKICAFGGYLNARVNYLDVQGSFNLRKAFMQPGETIEQCAVRELKEEANIDVSPDELEPLMITSDPEVDPRGHVINISYLFRTSNLDLLNRNLKAGDDISAIERVAFGELGLAKDKFAFDHYQIVSTAIRKIMVTYA